MKKNTIFIIIVVVVAVLAALIIWRFSQETGAPAVVPSAPTRPATMGAQDTTTAINDQLNTIDTNNLDGEFSDIDKDLQSL